MIETIRAGISIDAGVSSAGRVYGDAAGSAGRMSLSDSGCGCRYSIGDSETNFAGVSHRYNAAVSQRLEAIGTIRSEGASNRHAGISIDNGVTGGVSGGYVLARGKSETNRAAIRFYEAGVGTMKAGVMTWDLPSEHDTIRAVLGVGDRGCNDMLEAGGSTWDLPGDEEGIGTVKAIGTIRSEGASNKTYQAAIETI